MKLRAVLVGTYYDRKLYYLLEPYGDKNSTGALVDKNGNIEYIKFFSFIKSNPGIKEFRFSKFHKFLWSAPTQENKAKWKRIFINGTQPVDEEMLVGAQVITELSPAVAKKHAFADRALQFKSLNASQHASMMPGSVLGRYVNIRRTKIGTKGIGQAIGNKPAIDGDGDGFVDDGLATMRPFIPGFDFILDAAGNIQESLKPSRETQQLVRGGMRSGITTRPQTLEDRLHPITEEKAQQTMRKIRKYVEKTFNDGVPFSTKREVKEILAKHIPSFASGDSYIEFVDEILNDDDVLPNWARTYLDSFLLSIDAQPESSRFNYHIRKAEASKSFEGAVSLRPGLEDFVREPTSGLLKPQKKRRPLIVFEYKEKPHLTDRSTFAKGLKRAPFTVGSGIIDGIVDVKIRERGITPRQLEDLDKLDILNERIDGILGALEIMALLNPDAKLSTTGEFEALIDGTIGAMADIGPSLSTNAITGQSEIVWERRTPPIRFMDDKNRESAFIEQSLVKEWTFLASDEEATLADALDFLKRARNAVTRKVQNDNGFRKVQRKMAAIESESSIFMSGAIALHESNHMLHNIQAAVDAMEAAEILRNQIVAKMLDNLAKNGVDLTDEVVRLTESSVGVEDVYPQLYIERAVEMAQQDIELAKTRLMHSEMFSMNAINPILQTDPRSSDPNNPSAYFGWGASDIIADAASQMLRKFIAFNDAGDSSLSNNQKLAKTAIRDWLTQPTYDGAKAIYIGDGLARVLNEMSRFHNGALAIAFSKNGRMFQPGDELNLGMVTHLLSPDSISETGTARNVFSGLQLREYSAILDEIGFPDFALSDGSGNAINVRGLELDESRKLAAALLNIRQLGGQIPRGQNGKVQPNLSVQTTTSIPIVPGSILLPYPFKNMTKEEFLALPQDEFLKQYRELIENTVESLINNLNPNQFGEAFESGNTNMNWWDKLNKNEVNTMLRIIRNIGAPAPSKDNKSGTGYSPYMGFLRPPVFPGLATPPKFSEFFAELAVADVFGVPLSQIESVIDSDGNQRVTTRALSKEELDVVMKFMNWMYPNQLLSEKLDSVQ